MVCAATGNSQSAARDARVHAAFVDPATGGTPGELAPAGRNSSTAADTRVVGEALDRNRSVLRDPGWSEHGRYGDS